MKETADYWDLRAKEFLKDPEKSKYERTFLEMADIRERESVFDMGCASGTLALPLAAAGHRVLSCDFSGAMIELLLEEASKRGLGEYIDARILDWNEDWEGKDIYPCDVAIASRSFIADDIKEAVRKIDQAALRKVIITAPTELSSRWNINIAKAIGFEYAKRPGYLDVIEVLEDLGIKYGLDFIKEEDKGATFKSREGCIEKLRKGFPRGLSDEEDRKLMEYVESHYSDGRLDVAWPVKWAFIWWEK